MSSEVDYLYLFLTLVALFFVAVVAGAIAWNLLRYRRRGASSAATPHITGHTGLELTWIVVPLLLTLGIFSAGLAGYVRLQTSPAEAMEIQVTGKKWLWEFEYSGGVRAVNELHVPVNRPVRLIMSSQDVIHSFAVPAFRIKHDVLPKRYTEVWFEATQTGMHQVFCTEYCGKGHSEMLAKIWVDSEQGFARWLREGDEAIKVMPLVALGRLVYENRGCSSCHSLDGSGAGGPTWKGAWGARRQLDSGAWVTVDENHLRESIMDPALRVAAGYEAIMPTYQGLLQEREVLGVIELFKELR